MSCHVGLPASVLTLIETECLASYRCRELDELGVLATDFRTAKASQEVEVQNTTDGIIFQELLSMFIVVDVDIHSTRIQGSSDVELIKEVKSDMGSGK